MAIYILKEGAHQLEPDGEIYTNETITDIIALGSIKRHPIAITHFIELPKVQLPTITPNVLA